MEPAYVIKVLKNERECVVRNVSNNCNRKCEFCDLTLPDRDILNAYTFAIEKLSWYYGLNEEVK